MGVVYLGRDLRLDMDVAIKFCALGHSDATLWLKREFRVVASLRHPNLCELYELVATDGSCYFTMEFLPGVDPRRYVAKKSGSTGPFPIDLQTTRTVPPLQSANTELSNGITGEGHAAVARAQPVDHTRVRSVLAQLAEGLAFLHARGVIHRDVKPSNAIVVDGTVKLLDFGLALERARQDDDLAREARVVGTAAYLAPEYIERLLVGPAMDVYALGVLAYELVTGAPPFGGAIGFLSPRKRAPLPRASQLDPDLPPDLDEAIARMLTYDPTQRPTALEIAALLYPTDGAQSNPRPAFRAHRFVGRATELTHLAARIADPQARGRLLLVAGPSGVGKTALIEEACRCVDAAAPSATHTAIVWRGRCHERERVPYRAFDSIIDDLATQLASEPTLIGTVEHAGALGRVFPVLGALIEQITGLMPPPAIDLRVERERALAALAQLFRALNPRGVLAIDDLQWADADSLELLAFLVEKIDRPLTVLATWMTEEPPRAMRSLLERLGPAAELIDLPAMTEEDLASLIGDLAPSVPTERLDAAAKLAVGNPYLAEMIGRELADTDLSQPPSPHQAEARRISRLTQQEQLVAELASLATGATSFPQLRELAELPASRLSSVLRGLEEARVLRAIPSAAGDAVYAFYHQRLRDAAHEGMAQVTRRDRHARFAAWFERTPDANTEQLAYHWQHAGQPGRAARWAVAAGDAAFAQLAWATAADWYAKAIELDPVPSASEHVRTAELIAIKSTRRKTPSGSPKPSFVPAEPVVSVYVDASSVTTAPRMINAIPAPPALPIFPRGTRDDLRAALPPPPRVVDRRPVRAKLAEALMFDGRLAAAADHFLAVARERNDGDEYRVRAAEALLKLGEIERALALLDEVLSRRGEKRTSSRALSISRALAVGVKWLAPTPRKLIAADPVRADAYRAIASYLSTPHPIEALEYVLRGIALAERTGDLAAYAQGLAMLAGYLAAGTLGRFGDRALARADQLSQMTPTIYPQMVIHGSRGILCTLRGDWVGMRSCRVAGEHVAAQLGLERSWEASFLRTHGALGEIFACNPTRALEMLSDARNDDLFGRALAGSHRGRAYVLAGALDDARAQLRALEADPVSTIGVAAIYRGVFEAELALAEHDWHRAHAITLQVNASLRSQWLSTMPAFLTMVDIPQAIANLGMARAGDRDAAKLALVTAKRTAARSKHSFYAATALRLQAQAELLLGNGQWRRTLDRAATGNMTKIDLLAIAALRGERVDFGAFAPAVAWNTGGAIH
jgi:tetratricopeptide (TPR) repeat protein